MRRKVVRQGASTFMVSLPSKWAKAQNLVKGQEISIEQVEDTLLISAKGRDQQKRETTVTITKHTETSTRTMIVNAYRAGYDLITIKFASEHVLADILNTINHYLIGFDMIKQGKSYCTIENITEPSEEQFEVLFKKIFFNISLLIEKTEERLRGDSDFCAYRDITLKIHQYDNFCKRIIAKKNPLGSKAPLFWTFSAILIHAQRELYHINRILDNKKIKFTQFDLFDKVKKCADLLRDGYLKKDIALLEQLHALEKAIIYSDLPKILKHKTAQEEEILFHLSYAVKNFYLASSPLIGLLFSENKE